MEQRPDILDLLRRYVSGTMPDEQLSELIQLLQDERYDNTFKAALQQLIAENEINSTGLPRNLNSRMEAILDIDRSHSLPAERFSATARKIRWVRTAWFRYAAVAFIFCGTIAVYHLVGDKKRPQAAITEPQSVSRSPVQPGGNRAILTLGDGRKIILDDAQNGRLALQNGVTIDKTSDGQLVYSKAPTTSSQQLVYNTMTTPRGGQYRITLPDGTEVWLNAASSITYPAVFTSNERKVSVTGEVYFDVAEDKTKPFTVTSEQQVIEVLGTSFNVNVYDDEPFTKSTLLKGRVKVTTSVRTVILKPGEQALIGQPGSGISVKQVNTDMVTAWKNGLFNFNNADLTEVMRQLSRWYDIEVQYDGRPPDIHLAGEMQRSLNLSQVLNFLGKLGVRYRLEGKTLTIMEK